MKKTIQKQEGSFLPHLVKAWEDSDGVNFAIALSRITGWLLHVDWLTMNEGKEPVEEMKSLRVYVGDDQHNVFDLRGKQKIASFSNKIVRPIAKDRGKGKGGVLTRFYSEAKLLNLPLRIKPDLEKVSLAEDAIRKNTAFLEKIPIRKKPFIPAYAAANFTFGRCAVYATAMHDLTNLPVTAVIADRYTEQFGYSKTGYVHSIVLHPDGTAEDAWGRQSIEAIVSRYGIQQYTLNETEHLKVNENLKRNSPDHYNQAYHEAVTLIKTYCME
jgi:hypothetical protein